MSNGQGFFYSVFQGNKLNDNDVQGILNYVKAIESGVDPAEALKTNITGCSVAAQKYIKEADNAGKSTEQMKAGLKDAAKAGGGFKSVVANIGSTFLNSLIGAGIGIGINLIIAGITNLVKAADEAKKKAVENANAYNDQKKELESLKQKYIEIMDSEKDEATKAKELDTIKNALAETYGVEKEALDKLNESRQAGLDLMDEEAVKNAKTVINENQASYNKYSEEAMDTETGKSNYYQRKTGEDGTYAEQNNQEQAVRKFLEQYGISAKVEKDNQNTLHNFAFEYGESAYSAYENINDALSKLSEKEQKEGLNPIEQVVIDQLRIDSDKLKKYLYDSDNGIDNIMSSTADAFWTEYSSEFEKASNKSFDDIDTLDGLEQWKQGFIDSLGDFANDPYFSQYIEKLFDEKKKEIQNAAAQTEQSIAYPTVNVTELNTKLEETSEKLDKITTSASKVQSALKSAFSKESFNVDEVLSLVELIPELADKFKMNDDGTFNINYKDLQSGAESYIETQKQEIDTTNELIKAKIKELEANIALNKSNLRPYIGGSGDMEAYEYNQKLQNAIKTDEDNLSTLKAQLSEGQVKSEYLAKSAEDLSTSFSAVIDILTNRYEVITDVEDAISDNGSITLDTLNKVKEVYPELSDEVSNYMMGLIDEQSLLSKLKDAYDDDFYEYRNTIAQKIDLTDEELQTYLNALNTKYLEDENYYTHLGATSKNFVDYMKDNYALDIENCKKWCQAKERMQAQTITKIKGMAAGINIEDYYDFETGKKTGDWSELYSNRGLTASGVLGEINNILSSYGDGIKEFGNLFKSTSTLDAVSSKSSSSKKNSTKSTTNEVFDWIEVRLNRLADKTKSFFDKVSDYVANVTNERNLGKAINSTQKEIDANKKAEQKYRAKANSVNLSEDWKKKVREGNYSIDGLTDETLIKNIQDYQKWWEKARDSAQNIADLTEQKKDYLSQQFDSKYERQQRITDKYSTANDKINDIISYKENKGGKVSARDYNNLNRNLTSQNKSLSTQNKMLLQQQKTVQKGSAKWQEYQEKIDANSQSIRQNTIAIAENNNKKFDLKISDYERSVGNHERTVTNIQNSMDLAKAQGKKTGDSYYKNMINASKKQNTVLHKERNAIFNERKTVRYGSERYDELTEKLRGVDDQISENKKNQAEWNATIRNIPMDRLNEYLDIAEAIVSKTKSYIERISYINGESTVSANQIRSQKYSDTAIEKQRELFNRYLDEFKKAKKEGRLSDADEYQKLYLQSASTYNEMLKSNEELERQARDIELYRNYEKDLQHIEDVKKALSSLSDMINDDALYNDDGSFSEHGIAKIALTMKNLEEAKSSVDDYKKEIDALNKSHKQGKYNDDEYAEKLRELTDGYQNATSEVNNYTEAIKDLYKNQAQEELNALNELIDTRSEALQKKKEYYDYDKTIKNKTKDITAMQMQIEALNGVSTAEAKAQKALLEEQLSDLEEDLADTQADHIYQIQIDGLNEQKEILQDIYDKFVDSLNKCLDAEGTIISNATALSQNSIESVHKLLDDIAKARGYDLNYVDNNNSLAHFADGGKVISAKGKGRDDGVAWLKAGEFVLNEQAFKAFKYTLPTIDNLADKMSTMVKSASNFDKPVSIGDVQLIVQGNVDKNVMDDLKKYQKQITDSVITNITKDLRKVGYKR